LRILAVSDLRVQGIHLLERVAERLAPDLILYAGDDVSRFGAGRNSWSRLARRTRYGLAGVIGNDCSPDDARVFSQPGCRDLHREPLLLDGLAILGLQGAPEDECEALGATLYTRGKAEAHLERQVARAGSRQLLLVSHAPPRGVLDLAVRFGVANAGSSVVRAFADRSRVRGIVCGHVHLQGGRTEQVGRCVVVNIASHDDSGAPLRYALLDWNGRRLKALEIGVEKDRGEFDGIVGLGPRRAEKLALGGFRSIKDILDADDAALKRMFSRPEVARLVRARARAACTGSPVILDPNFTIERDATIVDVETSFLQDDPWLVGYKRWGERRVHQLYELDPKAHRRHLRQVVEALSHPSPTRFLQWGRFDRGAIRRAHANFDIVPGSWLQQERWTNAGSWMERAVALPVPDYKLKTIGRYFEYRFAQPDLDGRALGSWYSSNRNDGTRFDVRRALAYNRDDVQVVEHIIKRVARLVASKDAFVEPPISVRRKRSRPVARVQMTPEARARAVAEFMARRRQELGAPAHTPRGPADSNSRFSRVSNRRPQRRVR
jgi:hypothetical protein